MDRLQFIIIIRTYRSNFCIHGSSVPCSSVLLFKYLRFKNAAMLVILAPNDLKEELLAQKPVSDVAIQWIDEPSQFPDYKEADGYIDLGFDHSTHRIDILKQVPARPVIISSVAGTLSGLPRHFIRINGWRSFLKTCSGGSSRNG